MKQGILKQFMCILLVTVIVVGMLPMQASATVISRELISEVKAGCDIPVGGRKASFQAWSGTEGARIYSEGQYNHVFNGVRWYDETEEKYLQEGDFWITGHIYTVGIFLYVDNAYYYEFKTTTPAGDNQVSTVSDVDTYINGENAFRISLVDRSPASGYIAKYTFPECEDAPEPITEVGVTDLSYPVAGTLVDYDVSLSGSGYQKSYETEGNYTNGLLWYDATENQYLNKGDRYKEDHEYWLIIPIGIKEPNRFSVGNNGESMVTVKSAADEKYMINPYVPGNPEKRLDIYCKFYNCIIPVQEITLTGITPPKEGKTPDYTVSSSDTSKYDIRKIEDHVEIYWYEDGRVMEPTDTFQAGYRYQVGIEVYAKDGNIFAVDDNWDSTVTGTLDGNVALVQGAWEESADDIVELKYDFGVCENTLIKSIEIQGVESPVPGNTPSMDIQLNTSDYGLDEVRWYRLNGNEESLMASDDYFRVGNDYKVQIFLEAESNKSFFCDVYGESQVGTTVNGEMANVVSEQSTEKLHVVEFIFQWKPVEVSEVAVEGISEPKHGNSPDYSATVGNSWLYQLAPYGWDASGFYWFDSQGNIMSNEDIFQKGETYQLEIKLIPATENQLTACKFVQPVTATINGKTPTDVIGNQTTVYLYYEFECEKCETCTRTWEVEKKATETENGKKIKVCTVCGETEDAVIYAASDVKLSTASYTYDGGQKSPSVKIYDSKGKVIASTNYTVTTPSGRTKAGTYSYKVTFKNEYTGTKSLTLTIKPAAIGSTSLSKENYTYDGKSKKPTVTVKNSSGKKLVNDTDYTVTYGTGRTKIGKYKVTVKGKGNYSGSKVLYFEIGPKNPSSVKTTLYGYDDVKVSWSKVSGVTGYKVYYKKASASSYKLLKTTTETSLKKSGLSDGVKYDFKVIAYKKVSGNDCENAGKTSSIYTLKKISGVKAAKSSSKVKISWTNISGETGYQISQSTSKTKTNIVSTYKTTSGTSKTISATKGKTYYYKIRAYKEVDGKKIYGPWSDVKAYKR